MEHHGEDKESKWGLYNEFFDFFLFLEEEEDQQDRRKRPTRRLQTPENLHYGAWACGQGSEWISDGFTTRHGTIYSLKSKSKSFL